LVHFQQAVGSQQVHASGRYEELFLRYFPMNFF